MNNTQQPTGASTATTKINPSAFICLNRLKKLIAVPVEELFLRDDYEQIHGNIDALEAAFQQLENLPTGQRSELPFEVSDETWALICGLPHKGCCGSVFGCYNKQARLMLEKNNPSNPALTRGPGSLYAECLAADAYNTYCNARGWKSFDGKPLPAWKDVKLEIKLAWEASAMSVAEYTTIQTQHDAGRAAYESHIAEEAAGADKWWKNLSDERRVAVMGKIAELEAPGADEPPNQW